MDVGKLTNEDATRLAFDRAKALFLSGRTLPQSARMERLTTFEAVIRKNKDKILEALQKDLGKSVYEGFMAELGLVYAELNHAKKHLSRWMRPKRIKTGLAQMPGRSKIYHDPYGTVLVMSPWNYPFLLTIDPVIGAIAAGNTVIVKPSAYSPATSQIIADICAEAFPDQSVQVIQGGRNENRALLDMPFDYIFFTGSPVVGKLVMEAAAKNLTPMTLELGGKSPVIVDATADLKKTAKRILFGKLLNAGQTCIAPDYVLAERSIKDALITELKAQSEAIFKAPHALATWPKIINDHHFNRLLGLIEGEKALTGGRGDNATRQIEFTVLDEPALTSPVMSEEIFGPILPVLAYDSLDNLIEDQKRKPKPLALYLFTNDKETERRILTELSFGGGCVNDAVMHISSTHAPFGGVGNSGMGSYHGHKTFETFSHEKTILKRAWAFDLPVRHRPYKHPDKTLPEQLLR